MVIKVLFFTMLKEEKRLPPPAGYITSSNINACCSIKSVLIITKDHEKQAQNKSLESTSSLLLVNLSNLSSY